MIPETIDPGGGDVTSTMEPYVSLRKAAEILNVSPRQLIRLTQPPDVSRLKKPYVRVPVHMVGQSRKFLLSELRAWRKASRDAA